MLRLLIAGLVICSSSVSVSSEDELLEDARQASEATLITIRGENFTLAFQADNRNVSQEIFVTNPNVAEEEYSRERPVEITSANWQVAVIKDGDFACSGSVIGAYWVLTAAQCVDESAEYMVRAGTRYFRSGGQTREVDLVVLHSQYDSKTSTHDVAILRLSRRLRFGRTLQPVALATVDDPLPTTFFLSGWNTANRRSGQPYSGLRGINLKLTSDKTCAYDHKHSKKDTRYRRGKDQRESGRRKKSKKSKKSKNSKRSKKSKKSKDTKKFVSKATFCTTSAGRGRCHGDPGSALVHNGVQYGLFSFDNGCGSRYYSRVNSDLRQSRQWIAHASKEFAHQTQSVVYKARRYDYQ